ncbi:MAG: hypothetical protein HFI93_03015 [Lachnospiraceae bacterium]|nr:hypothetical protein [Lachnospiraceae bacterium]
MKRLRFRSILIGIILLLALPMVASAETRSYYFTFSWVNQKESSGIAVKDDNEQYAYMTGVEVFSHGETAQYAGFRVRESTGAAATGYHVFTVLTNQGFTYKYADFIGRHKFAYTVRTGVAGRNYELYGQYDDESQDTTPMQTIGKWTP